MSTTEWTILYHGGATPSFKGRAEFLRIMLEDAGEEYSVSADKLYGPTGWMDAFRGKMTEGLTLDAVINATGSPFPAFFPPAIWHRPSEGEPVFVTQTAACIAYIGAKLGFRCDGDAERARADNITINCMDFIAEGRSSFHPVENTASYSTQKEEGDRASRKWSENRMLLWLGHFEKIVLAAADAGGVAGGKSITFADFALFHVIDATASQFPEAYAAAAVPSIKAFHTKFAARPKLAAYRASDRCPKWAGDSMM